MLPGRGSMGFLIAQGFDDYKYLYMKLSESFESSYLLRGFKFYIGKEYFYCKYFVKNNTGTL